MPTLGNALDFAKYEARNIRGHQLGTAPASPVTGQLYYNTGDNTLYWFDGSVWVSARGGASATPPATTSSLGTIQLAGDLAGTATSPQIAAGVIVDADVAAANKDGTAATPSLRTLGTGAQQAAAGNDARLSDSRTPTAHHTTHEPGGSDPMTVDAAATVGSLRTLGLSGLKAMPGVTTLDAVTAPVSDVTFNGHKATNLVDPTGPQDAATKNYVDTAAQGLDAKQSVKAGSAGTNVTLSGAQTVDGVALVAGDRVLVKDQTTASQNGIYVVAAGAWARSTDTDSWAELVDAYAWVEQGTVNADQGWLCTVDQGGTLNTTAVTWTQFSGAGQITAGAGLVKAGNTINAVATAGGGLQVNADDIQIAAAGVTDTMLATPKSGYYSTATHAAGATWTIAQTTHGCRAARGLIVQCQIDATGAVVLPDITVASNGDVTVTFGASQTANTVRTTIVG